MSTVNFALLYLVNNTSEAAIATAARTAIGTPTATPKIHVSELVACNTIVGHGCTGASRTDKDVDVKVAHPSFAVIRDVQPWHCCGGHRSKLQSRFKYADDVEPGTITTDPNKIEAKVTNTGLEGKLKRGAFHGGSVALTTINLVKLQSKIPLKAIRSCGSFEKERNVISRNAAAALK